MGALVAALLLVAAPITAAREVAGLYVINQMEMGGGLELQPNGRFRYALEYGAVSEQGEGEWTVEGDTVRLTSNPMPPPEECDRGYASACFNHTPLLIEEDNFILWRWDAKIVFRPAH